MKGKKARPNNKTQIKNVIKDVVLLALICLAYFLSAYINGFHKTNKNLLILVAFSIVGFVGFYCIYYSVYFVTNLHIKIKRKKREKLLSKYSIGYVDYPIDKKQFYYNTDIEISKNLLNAWEITFWGLNDIATACGFKGKRPYLNFTLNDALVFSNKALAVLEEKIDEILSKISFLSLQDKPISFVENYVNDLVKGDKEDKKTSKTLFKKPITLAIKILCEEKINSAINYVLFEAYIVYSKSSKDVLKLYKKDKNNRVRVAK